MKISYHMMLFGNVTKSNYEDTICHNAYEKTYLIMVVDKVT